MIRLVGKRGKGSLFIWDPWSATTASCPRRSSAPGSARKYSPDSLIPPDSDRKMLKRAYSREACKARGIARAA